VLNWHAGLPPGTRRRVTGALFVLLLHFALGLLFVSIAPKFAAVKKGDLVVFSISAPEPKKTAEPEQAEEAQETEQAKPEPQPPVPTPPQDPPPVEVPPPPNPVALAPPPAAPPAAQRQTYGPPDLRPKGPPDSARVEGSGPNGEPLYAAAWYREPYDDELSGYLSTARGPGWGLIACRTVPSYRALMDEFGMSRETAFRWLNGWKCVTGEAKVTMRPAKGRKKPIKPAPMLAARL
jgi:protein TonB